MSETAHLYEPDCARAHLAIMADADGELSSAESAWLSAHTETCAECREAVGRFANVDAKLTAWGENVANMNPPAPGRRALLAVSLFPETSAAGRTALWLAGAALAAALLLTIAIPGGKTPGPRDASAFIEIPYLAPLDPHENSTVVRMDIRVATLISLGYRVTADPGEVVSADVLVGEDGRAHALRVRSDLNLAGMGD